MGKKSDEEKSFRERVEEIRQRKKQDEKRSSSTEDCVPTLPPVSDNSEHPVAKQSSTGDGQGDQGDNKYRSHEIAITRCDSCSERVPLIRYCFNCEKDLGLNLFPSRQNTVSDTNDFITTKVKQSPNNTLSADVLLSDHDKYHRDLGDYLFEDEIPIAVFKTDAVVIEGPKKETWRVDTSLLSSGHAIVSNKRVFGVFPKKFQDQLVSIDYTPITSVNCETGWTADAISLNLINNISIKFSVLEKTNSDSEILSEKIEENVSQKSSNKSQAVSFVEKVDNKIASADNAEEALQQVADLFVDREGETEFDRIIEDANSVDELLAQLPGANISSKNVNELDTDQKPTNPSTIESGDTLEVDRADSQQTIRHQVANTLKNANKREVALYGIGSMVALKGIAISAPISTSVALAGFFTGGAATGAYASTHPNSLAAQIDPVGLAMNSRSRGREWDASSAPGDQNVGEILGAIESIGDQLESEYAHWVADADFDQIQQGAAFGAQRGEELHDFESSRDAGVAGGLLGLTYGYAENADSDYELDDLLDEDLYYELLDEK